MKLERRIPVVSVVFVIVSVLGCVAEPSEDAIREKISALQERVEEVFSTAQFSELSAISDDAASLYRQHGSRPDVLRLNTSLLTMLGRCPEAEALLSENVAVVDDQLDLRFARGLLILLSYVTSHR